MRKKLKEWFLSVFDREYYEIQAWIRKAKIKGSLLILVWNTNGYTVAYETNKDVNCLDFFLEKTKNKSEYFYKSYDYREGSQKGRM